MAINVAEVKATAIAAIKEKLVEELTAEYGPEYYDAFASIVAKGVGDGLEIALNAIKDDAEVTVTGIEPGAGSASGSID